MIEQKKPANGTEVPSEEIEALAYLLLPELYKYWEFKSNQQNTQATSITAA